MRVLIASAFLIHAASAAAEPHTLAELLRPGEIQLVSLSPDGRRVAYVQRPRDGIADTVVVIELEGKDPAEAIRRFALDPGTAGARVGRLDWIGSQKLLAAIQPDQKLRYWRHFTSSDYHVHAENLGRLHVLDALGVSPPVTIEERFNVASFVDEAPRNPDFVTLQQFDERGRLSLYRVNLRDGSSELQVQGDPATSDWRVIDGRPVLKLNDVMHRPTTDVYLPAPDDPARWIRAGAFHPWSGYMSESRAIAGAESPSAVYRLIHSGTSNTYGIHRFDLAQDRIDASFAEHPQYDVRAALIDRGRLLAWTFVDDRLRQVIVEPALRPHHAGLEKYFGADSSVEIVAIDDAGERLLVRVSGPRQPDEYHWYDLAARRANLVVADRPWLDSARLAPSVVRRIRTRDGRTIDAYLTCPEQAPAVPAPLIVMPPPGPWTRAALRFDATAQVFAAQGWCVLAPNYRGVAGYGLGFEWQGYGEWSKLVVEDIADAVDDLIVAGIADVAKVVFYAEQLGAYAALAGSIEEPERYRAGVTWNAVSDLDAAIASLRMTFYRTSPIVVRWMRYRQDESRESSPLVRARGLPSDLLLMRNPALREVPVAQTDLLVKAMRKAELSPKVLDLPDDDSWSATANNEVLRLERAVSFLRAILAGDGSGGAP